MSPAAGAAAQALALGMLGGGGGGLLARSAARLARAPVGWRWMALAGGAACGAAGFASPAGWPALANGALALVLVELAAVDWAAMRLPDVLTLPLGAAGLVLAAATHDDLPGKAIGAAAGFLALAALAAGFRRATGRSGLGLGDAKLFATGGAWLGWEALAPALLIACGLGFAAVALAVGRRGLRALRAPIPFGPALCAAILAVRLTFRPG